MIACPNCGAVNALGKVFCTGCGQKLPTSGLVREDVERLGQLATRRRWTFMIVNIVLTSWLLLSVVLALWPNTTPLNKGLPAGAAALSMRRTMQALTHALQKGDVAEADVTAEEINAYVKYYVVPKANGRNGSVRIDSDAIRVRWLMRLFAAAPGDPGGAGPILSCDVTLRPSRRTRRLRVAGVRFGHLPLVWPLRGTVQNIFMGMCRSRPEWPLVRRLSIGNIEPGKLTIVTPGGVSRDDALDKMQESLPGDAADGSPNADGTPDAGAGAR
jgi:hypothetical protein